VWTLEEYFRLSNAALRTSADWCLNVDLQVGLDNFWEEHNASVVRTKVYFYFTWWNIVLSLSLSLSLQPNLSLQILYTKIFLNCGARTTSGTPVTVQWYMSLVRKNQIIKK
jgi:hypothetical protein